MKSVKVDKRITGILSFLSNCNCVADIGCDHGLTCVCAIILKKAKFAIATDISDLSLNKAKAKAEKENLEDVFDFRCGDGLSVLKKNEADTIIISGVGGELLTKILDDGKHILSKNTKLILSANNKEELVRRWIIENEFCIIDESIVFEKGKYYQIIVAEFGSEKPYTDLQLELGKINILKRDEVFLSYMNRKIKGMNIVIKNIEKNSNNSIKQNEFIKKLREYKEIIK